jgi:urease subunit gamma/beta
MDDGVRLVVLLEPLGPGAADDPGTVVLAGERAPEPPARDGVELVVVNTSARIVRVSSHHPFHLVNPRLEFDRSAAVGYRLDLPSGSTERWAPGERRVVRLVRSGGDRA